MDAKISSDFDVIVIGAGMAGLTAAASLSLAELKVLVLEARDRTGGRIHTFKSSENMGVVDLGASFIHGIDGNPLTDVAHKLGLRLYGESQEAVDAAVYVRGQQLPAQQADKLFHNLHNTMFDSARAFSQIQSDPHPATSLQDWIYNDAESPLYEGLEDDLERECARRMVLGYNGWPGADLDKVSLRHWGFEREYEGVDMIVQDGYHNMVSALERLVIKHGGRIALKQEVTQIEHKPDLNRVAVRTKQGQTFDSPLCICTLPLGVLKYRPPVFQPPLPPRRQRAIHNLGFGLLNKVVVTYPEVWWELQPLDAAMSAIIPEDHLTEQVPYVKKAASLVQPYVHLTDGRPTLLFYLGGSSGEQIEKLTDGEARDWAHGLLKANLKITGDRQTVPEPTEVLVTRWKRDPFACGSYAYFPPADTTSPLDMVELSRPLFDGRLGWAGEATQMDTYAAVHGALMSGYDEAVRAGLQLGKRVPSRETVINSLQPA